MELTVSQEKFYEWLKECAPYLLDLWDWNDRSLSLDRVKHYLAVSSHGEIIMCQFAVGVWLGRNEYDFDLFKAVGVLDAPQRAAIAEWVKIPLWP